jgi:hypothetical protein
MGHRAKRTPVNFTIERWIFERWISPSEPGLTKKGDAVRSVAPATLQRSISASRSQPTALAPWALVKAPAIVAIVPSQGSALRLLMIGVGNTSDGENIFKAF